MIYHLLKNFFFSVSQITIYSPWLYILKNIFIFCLIMCNCTCVSVCACEYRHSQITGPLKLELQVSACWLHEGAEIKSESFARVRNTLNLYVISVALLGIYF